ncbi:MAG: hypothetical protein HQK77_05045 [Desulfobacterales bacterium]|nr:hypothetical protein [Desulfobacterales bacterium]
MNNERIQQIVSITQPIAQYLHSFVFFLFITNLWVFVFCFWIVNISLWISVGITFISAIPLLILYDLYGTLCNILELPTMLTEVTEAAKTSKESINEKMKTNSQEQKTQKQSSFRVWNIVKYLYELKGLIFSIQDMISVSGDILKLTYPLYLMVVVFAVIASLGVIFISGLTLLLSVFFL